MNNKMDWFIGAVIAVVCLLLVVGGILLFANSDRRNQPSPMIPPTTVTGPASGHEGMYHGAAGPSSDHAVRDTVKNTQKWFWAATD